jgi:hypothetical protein
MSLPTLTVGVALGVAEAGDFIIGDGTRGLIGSTSYTIASGYTTVTADAFGISITRGRWSRLWDAVEAGSCQISLRNNDRDYDPAYLPGPYATAITPGRGVNIKANDVDLFTGWVDDWQLEYDVGGLSSAILISTDALGMFGALEFDAWTSAATTAGGKLSAVCERSEVAWPAPLRDFDEGVEALQSDAVSWGSSVLNYAQLIARSELGYFYSTPDGVLTFRDRTVAVGATSAVSFSDDGTGIAYQGISATVGSDVLFSHVRVDREGGTAQSATVSDTSAWIEANGPLRSLSISGLLLDSDAQSLALAEYLLSLYDTGRYRISELRVDITPLSTVDQTSVLSLDITDLIDVTYTPNGVGAAITQPLLIQGIRHDIGLERHTVTFSTIDAPVPGFRIGDTVMGVIGNTTYLIGF